MLERKSSIPRNIGAVQHKSVAYDRNIGCDDLTTLH